MHVKVVQSWLTHCDPMDCSPPGFSIHGISQARMLEWIAISFSRGPSQPRDRTPGLPHCWQTLPAEPPEKPFVLKGHLSGTYYLNDLSFKKYKLWGKSLKLAFVFFQAPGTSLVVQWLRLLAYNAWAQVQSLVRELKSHMLHTTRPLHPAQKRSSLWIFFGLNLASLPRKDVHQHRGHFHLCLPPEPGHHVPLQHRYWHCLGAGQWAVPAGFPGHPESNWWGGWGK